MKKVFVVVLVEFVCVLEFWLVEFDLIIDMEIDCFKLICDKVEFDIECFEMEMEIKCFKVELKEVEFVIC